MGARLNAGYLLRLLLLAATYFVAGKLGLQLAFVHASATVLWLPAGISLWALLVGGLKYWPGIFVAALLVNLTTEGNLATCLGIATGNTLEAVLGCWLVNRYAGGCRAFECAEGFVRFTILACLLSTTVSATFGVTSQSLGGFANWQNYGAIWFTWWLGDAVSALLVVPPLALWTVQPRLNWTRWQTAGIVVWLWILLDVGLLVFGGWGLPAGTPVAFLCLPILIWGAFRFGPRETATATLLLAALALAATWGQVGPFAGRRPHESLLLVQSFLAVAGLMAMLISQIVLARKRAERELREAHAALERRVQERTADLRATQHRLQHVLNASPASIYTAELEGGAVRITWASDNVDRLTGFRPEETLEPGWFEERLHPEDRAAVVAEWPRAMSRTHSVQEYRFRCKDGSYRWLLDERRAVEETAADGPRIVGSWMDLTDRKRLEEDLRQAQKMEAIGRLAGGVAHDFNNILTVINGYSALALGQIAEGDPVRQAVAQIRDSGERAALLTGQLLAFSRKQVLRPALVDLNALLARMEGMLARLIGEDVELVIRPAHGLRTVKADAAQLEQVVLNLVVNARDAMPNGGQLMIHTANVDGDETCGEHSSAARREYVLLAINDTGCGMDEATRERVFEPFFTTKGPDKGTGLGLATVYGAVTQSGGHVQVQSAPGAGTTFQVYLPASRDAAAREVRQDVSAPPTGHETVLLAEDRDAVRKLVRACLERDGYQVLDARNGDEAMRICNQHPGPIDILVTDVVMPRLSGRQLAEAVLSRRPHTKVLYMSGYDEDAISRHGPESELSFLQKPFTPDALARKIREVLDHPAAAGSGAASEAA
jgi:PAS domain S-box-containing protein